MYIYIIFTHTHSHACLAAPLGVLRHLGSPGSHDPAGHISDETEAEAAGLGRPAPLRFPVFPMGPRPGGDHLN